MVRPLRIEFPGALYHLTARSNARQDIFLDDEDRGGFLSLLGCEIQQQHWRCYVYCLMSNPGARPLVSGGGSGPR